MIKTLMCLLLAMSVAMAGCATVKENRGTFIGSAAGCLVGVGICVAAGGSKAQCAAACAAGLVAGAVIGRKFDERRKRLEEIARNTGTPIEIIDVAVATPELGSGQDGSPDEHPAKTEANGLLAEIGDPAMFDTGVATPSPRGRAVLATLAREYANRKDAKGANVNTRLLITGHTDSVGTAESNQRLSEARARAVAELFNANGLPADALYLKGAGAAQPKADNSSEEGRASNRRVEVLEVDSEQNLLSYADARARDRRNLARSIATEPVAVIAVERAPTADLPRPAVRRPPANRRTLPAASSSPGLAAHFDFKGETALLVEADIAAAIGPAPTRSAWRLSPISDAQAAEPLNACFADGPRVDGEVVRFSDGSGVSRRNTAEFMPGLYGGGWGSTVVERQLGFAPVRVLRDGGRPDGNPTVYFAESGNASDQRYEGVVSTYEGSSGLLYRVFLTDANAPFRCFDVVLPKGLPFESPAGWLYYRDAEGWKHRAFKPMLIPAKS